MADLIVIEELQAYLVAQGVGIAPASPPPAAGVELVTIWTAPRDGAALPRNVAKVGGRWQGESTVTLTDTLGRSPSALEEWMTETFIDVVVRSPRAQTGKLLQRQIHALIVPFGATGGRKQWLMNSLLVEQSLEWRGDQPLPQRQAVAENDRHATYDRVQSFCFRCRRKILAGLTIP